MKDMKLYLKSGIGLLAAMALFFTIFMSGIRADAAKKSTAISIKLAQTEGKNIKILNASGKSLSVKDNMRLYSGYTIETKKDSYVYLYLDDTKAIKLDQYTKVKIKKQGGKNEINISTGKVFFNVTKKLKSNEKVTIKTSNITMGIRGTCGTVAEESSEDGTKKDNSHYVQIYEGIGAVSYREDGASELGTWEVLEGKKSYVKGKFTSGVIKLEDIPAFALSEILKDEKLLAKLLQLLGLTKEQLQAQYEINVLLEQEKYERIRKRALEKETQLFKEGISSGTVKDKDTEDGDDDDDDDDDDGDNDGGNNGGGNNGGGNNGGGNNEGGIIVGSKGEVDVNKLKSKLDSDTLAGLFEQRSTIVINGTGTLSTDGVIIIPSHYTLTIDQGVTFNVRLGDKLVNHGTFYNNGFNSLYCYGVIINKDGGRFYNRGKAVISANGTMENYGNLINHSDKYVSQFINHGKLINYKFIRNVGRFINTAVIDNHSKIENQGIFQDNGTLNDYSGGGGYTGNPVFKGWEVNFYDSDEQKTLLKHQVLDEGQDAVPPKVEGTFTGWSEQFVNVKSNIDVYLTRDAHASCLINGHMIGFYSIAEAYKAAETANVTPKLYTNPVIPTTWKFTEADFELDLTNQTLSNIRIEVVSGAALTLVNGEMIVKTDTNGGEMINNQGSLNIRGTRLNYKAAVDKTFRQTFYGIRNEGKLTTEDMQLSMEDYNIYNKSGILVGIYLKNGSYLIKSGTKIQVKATVPGMKPYSVQIVEKGEYTIAAGAEGIEFTPELPKLQEKKKE